MIISKINKNLNNLKDDVKKDYRFIPFGIIALYIITLLFSEYYFGTYTVVAKHFSFGPYQYFYDLKITLGGIDAFRNKIDPYTLGSITINEPPYFCYPSTWQIFSIFPFITMSNLVYIGFGMAIIYYLALYFYIGKINFSASIVYTLLLTSSAFLLGVVGGNVDVFIFTLLLIPLLFKNSTISFAVTILALSMLKLFPIAAIIGLFNKHRINKKRLLVIFFGVIGLFIIFLFLMRGNLARISNIIPKPTSGASYGIWSIPSLISAHCHLSASLASYSLLLYGSLICIAFITYFKMMQTKVKDVVIANDNIGTSYLVGSSIFMVSFLMGYSCEYRLIFLILTIPQILNWIKNKKHFARTLLLLTFIVTWQYSFYYNFIPEKYETHYHIVIQLFMTYLFFCHTCLVLNFFQARFGLSMLRKKNQAIVSNVSTP